MSDAHTREGITRAQIHDAGLDLVAAALDVLSLADDRMARPRGPVTISHALDLVADAAATVEQLCADRLDDPARYLEPGTRAANERRQARREREPAQHRAAG